MRKFFFKFKTNLFETHFAKVVTEVQEILKVSTEIFMNIFYKFMLLEYLFAIIFVPYYITGYRKDGSLGKMFLPIIASGYNT